MEDVASRAGVSRALVSLVMRNSPKVSERSRIAVLEAAEELGYRRNLMAHHLASRRTMTIGLVLNDLHNPFFAEMTDGIHKAALETGYRIVINTGLRNRAGEKAAVDTFLEFRTDGIILVGSELSSDTLEALAAGPAPGSGRPPRVSTSGQLRHGQHRQHGWEQAKSSSTPTTWRTSVQRSHQSARTVDGGPGAGPKAP